MKAIEAKNVTFTYKGQTYPILEQLFFELDCGQVVAITGPSGCGKSTLGYCISGVIPRLIDGDFSGEIELKGRVGIVFQDPDDQIFLPTVEDELAFGPENLCLSKEQIRERINEVLEITGLTDVRLKNPAKLSGGQKQLVALGGVLTLDPDVLVLDETLSQLDENTRKRIKSILLELKKQGKTILMIEHDKINLDIADQIFYLNNGKLKEMVLGG